MIPTLEKWFDEDSGIRMVLAKDMETLTGADEYAVSVVGHHIGFTRFVCMVGLDDDLAWADTTTGSLYREGQCLSGMLRFNGKPKPTGRTVPNWNKRQKEGDLRTRIW